MAELDLKTALSVFAKMPGPRVKFALAQASEWAQGRLADKDIPALLAKEGWGGLEIQIGTLAIHHHGRAFKEMGSGHGDTLLNFAKVLAHKPVGQDKIALTLRGAGFREEDIRDGLVILSLMAPGQVLPGAEGRGSDEFSVKLRERFAFYLDGFLVGEWVGRMTLSKLALDPAKTRSLKLILKLIPLLDGQIQASKPFWWEVQHERMLHDALLRRIPQLVLEPLNLLAETYSQVPPAEVLKTWLSENKHPEYLAELFPLLIQPMPVPSPAEPWVSADLSTFQENLSLWSREAVGLFTYFTFEGKGSSGWKHHSDLAESLSQALAKHHIRDGKLHLDGYSPEGRELALHITILSCQFPTAASAKTTEMLKLTQANNLTTAARIYRTLFE